jgi:hypothetical protein
MRTKSLVLFRSKSTGFEEGKMEKVLVLDPRTVWEPSTVTEEQIQALVDRELLRTKMEVGCRPAAGEEFPMEGTGETVVFLALIEHGFGVPAGDFLHGLLFFYRIELVHLVPKLNHHHFYLYPSLCGLPRHRTTFPLVAPLLRAEEDGQHRGRRERGFHVAAEHEVRVRRPRAP